MADTIVVVTEVPVTVEVSGPQGPQGTAGQGVATGGTTGQVLKKKSGTDYDTEWGAAASGSGTVTSLALAGTGLSISGSPVTTSGTITANVSYGTTAGTATQGNDARIATIGSGAINTATGVIQTQPETLEVYSLGRSGLADLKVYSVQLVDDQNTGYVGSLSMVNDLTADRGYYMPNATGTVALTQQATDYEVTNSSAGIIMKSPNGSRWRLTIDNNGVLLRTALALIFSLSFMCGAQAQVRDLVYGTNNVVIGPTNTNALSFTNSVAFSNPLTFGTNAATTRTNLGVTVASNLPAPYSGAAASNSLLTADGAGGSSFVANRLSVSGLTTNVVRTSWANVGADKATNDTGLSLSYAANSVYSFKWSVFVSSTWSNVAYGIAFSGTNSFTVRNGYQVTPFSSTPSGATIAVGATNTTLVSDSTSSYPTPAYVGGELVFFSTNAGTLNFRFWTTASNTNTSTLFSNSIISLEKIYP